LRFFVAGDAASLADAVIELGHDSSLRNAFSERACSVYQNLRWSRSGKEYVRIVDSLSGKEAHADV
ncbi:MAG TPA: hypothetical protein VJ904_12615, partial [Tichowtungia sp.]|nr:hypothetical protein [Tichowtungia sp.]